jgi:histidinol dehydrogenase
VLRLEPGRERELAAGLRATVERPADLGSSVAQTIEAVRGGGDAALRELRRRFEGESAPESTRVEPDRIAAALAELDPDLRAGLELAAANIRQVAQAELATDLSVDLPQGQRVQLRSLPVGSAGVYAPGGRAAYPSTVLMCCLPAKVAGVGRVVVASPPGPSGEPHPAMLAAAALAEADELHAMGGAQAIAALALGTETIDPVDVIAGPGNAYVQEAKRQLVGTVGIDGIAGPSEVVLIADDTADVRLAALDLAAQAEHGRDSPAILICTDRPTLDAIVAAYDRLASETPVLSEGQFIVVEAGGLEDALRLADAIAPEHLELSCADSEQVAQRAGAAGAIFHGPGGSAVFGDYVAGSNHVLPTGGAARFSGPLGVATFRRRQALVSLPDKAARALAPHVSRIAHAEGFPIHAQSAQARSEE